MPRIHSHRADFMAESTALGPSRLPMSSPPVNSRWAWSEHVPGSLIDGIYDAVVDARRWFYVLSQFMDDLPCTGASFCVRDSDPFAIHHLVAVQRNADGRGVQRYHYAAPYLLWAEGKPTEPWNPANARLVVVPPEAFERSQLFSDLLASQRAGRWLEVLRLVHRGIATCLTLFRSDDMDDFGSVERQYLNALKPHLRRAAQLSLTLADLRAERKAQMEALDRLPFGTVALDSHGRVLLMNRSAKRILSETDALKIKLGRLAGARTKDTCQLEKFFSSCARKGLQPEPCGHELLSFSDVARQKSVSLVLAPVNQAAGLDSTDTAVTGFVFDSDHRPNICRPTLERLYQLTAAESRLVEALVSGETLESAACRFGVSKQTVRKQLGTVYQKTGTNRQAELMTLVLSGPAIIEQLVPS